MPLDYLAAYGKTHACSAIFPAAMQPLEGLENAFGILLVESNAVILNKDLTSPSIVL